MTGLVMLVAGLLTAALCVVVLFVGLVLWAGPPPEDEWERRELWGERR